MDDKSNAGSFTLGNAPDDFMSDRSWKALMKKFSSSAHKQIPRRDPPSHCMTQCAPAASENLERQTIPATGEVSCDQDTELPAEVLQTVFSHLFEKDLCKLARVNKRFHSVVNDSERWEQLYKEQYEYELPLIHEFFPRRFYFVQMSAKDLSQNSTTESTDVFPGRQIESWVDEETMPEDGSFDYNVQSFDSPRLDFLGDLRNAWKESFGQLYRAVHVRPGYKPKYDRGTVYFDTIRDAMIWCQQDGTQRVDHVPIIVVHAGRYVIDSLYAGVPMIILGCGPGPNPAETVVFESRHTEAMITFNETYGSSYLGYVTLRNNCVEEKTEDSCSGLRYCVSILDASAANIDHCILRAEHVNGIRVADSAQPVVRNCDLSDIGGTGIHIQDSAGGLFERNKIVRCHRAFGVEGLARPMVRKHTITGCRIMGVITTDEGLTHKRVPWM